MKPALAYGLLGLPLAMAALPVYVHAPTYYAGQLGMALSTTGWVLFGARLIDTVQDPWLGYLIDRRAGRLSGWMLCAGLLLAISFAGLWLAPVQGSALIMWLVVMLIGIYTAHSMLNIAYLAWGARLGDQAVLLHAAAWREGAGLIGVVLASIVPGYLMAGQQVEQGMAWYALAFALLLALGIVALLYRSLPWLGGGEKQSWREPLANLAFRRLLLPYFLNAVSVAIPATLALFYIRDRIAAPQLSGAFLAAYFVAAALGLPLWVRLAKKIGTAKAWRLGMILAVLAFAGAALLSAGDVAAYAVVCILAGLALGADLALPPVLLAGLISPLHSPASYYGIWTLLGKLALALSGLALPLLAWGGYQPGVAGQGGLSLALTYAALPCAIKLLAMWRLNLVIRQQATLKGFAP
ncbi:MFS transporter [Iodobacter fluviatilis]|uniref:Melibiose:sodium symporter n=1 Tax=Iodobacter fluviatilis TaxID=537 RepID=A0A377SWT4_9NEIS|nr:MFS transporter [Iodobacter fluviatilis]TCU87932.1 Na+/melibiose symporter-like transporter [Iodobacter fluviatilis]STR45433.1 melibiose:sodium symporter [Iodobacter fluviatilis]